MKLKLSDKIVATSFKECYELEAEQIQEAKNNPDFKYKPIFRVEEILEDGTLIPYKCKINNL